jgi:hypothetical protein
MRYFIIFFNFQAGKRDGSSLFCMISNEYPNRKKVVQHSKEHVRNITCAEGDIAIVFTNIIELTEKDYLSFNK